MNQKVKYKIGFDWYASLTEEQQDMWFENFNNKIDELENKRDCVETFLNHSFFSLEDFLMQSFLWDESVQGHKYWENLSFRN